MTTTILSHITHVKTQLAAVWLLHLLRVASGVCLAPEMSAALDRPGLVLAVVGALMIANAAEEIDKKSCVTIE